MKRPPPRVTPPMAEETNQRAVREKRAAQVSLQVCVCVCVSSLRRVQGVWVNTQRVCCDLYARFFNRNFIMLQV